MSENISINKDAKTEELKLMLKETNLSNEQINEIIPVILNTLSKIKEMETKKTESDTTEALSNLNQTIKNNISVNVEDNDWTVTINLNTEQKNVINIVINNVNVDKKPEEKVEEKPEEKPEEKVEEKPEEKPEEKVEEKPEEKVEEKPDKKPEEKPEEKVNEVIEYTTSETTKSSTDKVQSNYEKDIHTPEWFLAVLDNLLDEIEDTRKWITKRWVQSSWEETMKNSKQKLKQYEKQINAKRNALKKAIKKWSRPEIYESDITHVQKLKSDIDAVRHNVSLWQWGESSNLWSFLYNSPENTKKSNKYQAESLEFKKKLQEELKKWAILRIFNWSEEKANDFYRRIAQWEYYEADYQLFVQNSDKLIPSFQKCGINIPTNPGWTIIEQKTWLIWWKVERTTRSVDYSNMDRWDAFQKWWVVGMLDKLLSNCGNMTPWQKETWKSVWVLWILAWSIYGLYKFYTNKEMSFWSKAWITAWAIFGSQFLTWEGPLSLFSKVLSGWLSLDELKDKFGNAVWTIWLSESGESASTWWESVSETIVPSMYSMMIFNSSTKVSDIRAMTETFKDNNNRKAFYDHSCKKLEKEYGTQAVECFRATFSDQFNETKWKNRLAWFGVTDWTDQKESVYWLANNATMNKTILEKFKADYWLKENTDNDALKQYINDKKTNNQPIDVDDLNEHISEWFIVNLEATHTQRPEDEQNRNQLSIMVDWLPLDTTKKEELKIAIKQFYDEKTINTKPKLNDFSLKIEDGLLVMKSHKWNETKIDINNNSIKENNNEFRLNSLSEALNTADLTNYILELTNKKTPTDMPAFEYQIAKKAICFNDATFWSLDNDTRILNINRFKDRSTVDKNASDYANYLSIHWLENNKINIDATQYPIVKDLSDSWITFTNEQEIKDLETRLQSIKEWRKFSVWSDKWNPYKISRQFKTLSNKLVFTAVNWEKVVFEEDISSKFPTLIRKWNKEKFVEFMNDPKNKMRWSATS